MIAAAVALAYYGFKHAEDVARPVEQYFRLESQDYADTLARSVERSLDKEALALFEKIAVMQSDPLTKDGCVVEAGTGIESFAVLGENHRLVCSWPSSPTPKRRAVGSPAPIPWESKSRKLDWSQVRMGNFAYHHEQLDDGGSALFAYTLRRDSDGDLYRVVARIRLDFIGNEWSKEELQRGPKNRRVTILDESRNPIVGEQLGMEGPLGRLFWEGPFGKALYGWRIQMVPQNAEEFRAQWERTKDTRRALIVMATVIIAVGLTLVWLAILAERRASRMKSDFIANVSHELKTPLSLIRMFGEMVATGRHKGEEAAREYGAIITRESERLSHLIDNVLDFSRLERGQASYHFAEGDLADVVARSLDVCRYRLERENLKLQVTIEPTLPLVRMDENEMTLVVLNLVDNAIKHAPEGKIVCVSVTRSPGFLVLGVRDFGPGILRHEMSQIFERFYRTQSTRERNIRGSGIGLALVKHIAEAHGGRVSVESPVMSVAGETQAGAMFRVFLPASMASEERHSRDVADVIEERSV
jgi:two-component system phosphate regulon sensor histidine kinase PhoR